MSQLNTPYADLLPPLTTEEFASLKADIKKNGMREPVIVDEGDNILDGHRRFRLSMVCYDPYQAALMAQRLERRSLKMEEVPFNGKNLTTMASTLLEVFRSRRIDLYDHQQLVADLSRLSIVEKSYGYRLDATRDANGHADLATALAIALPHALTSQPMSGNSLTGWGDEQFLARLRARKSNTVIHRPYRGARMYPWL